MSADPATVAAPASSQTGAAILLMLLEEEQAAEVLKLFNPDEARQIAHAMFAASAADERGVEAALRGFVEKSRSLSALAVRAEPRIRNVVSRAFGDQRASDVLDGVAPREQSRALDMLRWMETSQITEVLAREHVQLGAVIVSMLTPEIAALAIEPLPEETQGELLLRAARLSNVSAEAMTDIEALLEAASVPSGALPKIRMGGRGDAAKIVNKMSKPAGERILKALKKKDKQLSREIEEEMFTFEDLDALDTKALGALLRSIDASLLSLALKGAPPALAERMLGCMSARAADAIRDDMAERGPTKRSDTEDAQRDIVAIARRLADDGTISFGGSSDDYV